MGDGSDGAVTAAAPIELPPMDPRLAIWLSPAFPVGAFAYSHGLEWAAQKGWVKDRRTLAAWLTDLLRHGGVRNDLIIFRFAAAAVGAGDVVALADLNALALALQPSAERHLESRQQGQSFIAAVTAAWGTDAIVRAVKAAGEPIAYPVAVAIAVAGHGIGVRGAMLAFALAFAGNLVSAAIRLSVIGQTDGQRVLADVLPVALDVVSDCERASLDDIGGSTVRSDIASLAHETQYTRLFRS